MRRVSETKNVVRQITVEAEPMQLTVLARFAAHAAEDAGFEPTLRDRIELAMDEACSNIIEHAYAGCKGNISVWAEIHPERELVIKLEDQGSSFLPEQIAAYVPHGDPANVKIGGLGLFLMHKVMDEIRFEFDIPGVGNRLTMIKRIKAKWDQH